VDRVATRTLVAIALGSNLGDRRAHLEWAVGRLRALLDHLRVSTVIETDPVDVPDDQPPYLNAVAVGETVLDPEALLSHLHALERERGRARPAPRAARTLDLDLILYGDRILQTSDLEIPHPRFRDREFVLGPLAELEPDMIDPMSGLTIAGLLRKVRGQRSEVRGMDGS
jgi:2-amino-4-hydroxy-6-hydroxymethyldihydropteridine diphosphokinase